MSLNPETLRLKPFDMASARRSIFQSVVDARRDFGGSTVALVDGDRRPLLC